MRKIIVNSSALYKVLYEYLASISYAYGDTEIAIKCERGDLSFGGHKKTINAECKQDFKHIYELRQLRGLLMLTKSISEQPITICFKNSFDHIEVQTILI